MSFLWPKKKDQCDAGFNFNPHVHGIIFAWTNFHVFFTASAMECPMDLCWEWDMNGIPLVLDSYGSHA